MNEADSAAAPRIVAWHADFLVAVKPAGLSFHQDGAEEGFVAQLKRFAAEPGLHAVHRLDRITSGLVLFARHADAARELGRQFEAGEVMKFYLALSDRKPAKKQGWVRGAMLRGRGGDWRLGHAGGPLAVTQFFSYALVPGLRLFLLRPRTGRTHQLRVALKSLSAPILGDARYGGTPADRGYLHAYALRFNWQGEWLDFRLPPEEGTQFQTATLQAQLAALGEPWALPWPGGE